VTVNAEWSNVFLLTFDEDGQCSQYQEWYFEKPDQLDHEKQDEDESETDD
jgi:hypothetical protein